MKIHKYALAIPEMTDEEYENLKVDLKANGQKIPIVLYNNQILDGRHRFKALTELKVQPKTTEFKGTDVQAAQLVISLNINRRHLTVGQRAMIAIETLKPAVEKAAKEKQVAAKTGKPSNNSYEVKFSKNRKVVLEPAIHTDEILAKAAGVSRQAISQAIAVTTNKKLTEGVKSGKVSLGSAHSDIRKSKPVKKSDQDIELQATINELLTDTFKTIPTKPEYAVIEKIAKRYLRLGEDRKLLIGYFTRFFKELNKIKV